LQRGDLGLVDTTMNVEHQFDLGDRNLNCIARQLNLKESLLFVSQQVYVELQSCDPCLFQMMPLFFRGSLLLYLQSLFCFQLRNNVIRDKLGGLQ